MKNIGIKNLYYITHINNVPSILERGILSHERVEKDQIEFERIYDTQIVSIRDGKKTPDGKDLWNFANLYFQARNPMLYRVIHEKSIEKIVVLALNQNILNEADFISTGNAASSHSEILPQNVGLKEISQIRKAIAKEWWSEIDDSKRKIMAECLVSDRVPPKFIQAIYVANHDTAEKVKAILEQSDLPVIPEPKMFFQPTRTIGLTPNLSLIQGDMFFSKAQTLTVSVNCVGVMGKGLASRAKYQFPDVYVFYQDLCREKKLRMGKPYIYQRGSSLDYQLAYEPLTLSNANMETWFLLFPTKRHWRERSDIRGIERGLQWLKDNYKKEGVSSLAIPALGCGLGKLEWRDVGPLLCKYLSTLDIPVRLYLPLEKGKIPEERLSKDFLLTQAL